MSILTIGLHRGTLGGHDMLTWQQVNTTRDIDIEGHRMGDSVAAADDRDLPT